MNELIRAVIIFIVIFGSIMLLIWKFTPPRKYPKPPKVELGEWFEGSLEFRDLEIGPNDILVVQCDRQLNELQRATLTDRIMSGVHDKLIIVDGVNLSFQVIRRK